MIMQITCNDPTVGLNPIISSSSCFLEFSFTGVVNKLDLHPRLMVQILPVMAVKTSDKVQVQNARWCLPRWASNPNCVREQP